jgi:transcriptional regulator of acetoin/glycerol metabolism
MSKVVGFRHGFLTLEREVVMQPLEHFLSPIVTNTKKLSTETINQNDITLMHKIKEQKMAVLEKRTPPSNSDLIRPEIIASWVRSAKNGLDPYKYKYPPLMEKHAFEQRLKEKAFFIQAAEPYIRQLEAMLSDVECYIVLSDQEGVILRIGQALDENRFHLAPGAIWSEETTGTCSHGMCILLKSPIQLCGPEHFSQIFERISCSSAPVFDLNGSLEGTLTITNPNLHSQNSHSLGLVVTMASAIQKDFQLSIKNELLNTALAAANDAVIIIDEYGRITVANTVAHDIFDSSGEQLVGTHIEDILGEQPLIKSALETRKPLFDTEIQIKKSKQKLHLYSVQPVKNYNSGNAGCILTFAPADKAKNHRKPSSGSATRFTFDNIVGSSSKTTESLNLAKKFARFNSNILIQGESGTGKEVYAQAIHNDSRPDGPFIAVNCAAIPKNLIESELFGYEAGAFTGAERQGKPGKIELANGGTLFLDEIGDMPPELQVALLRVLEDKMIMHVGGSRYIPVDFRLISASNKDLLNLLDKNEFRADLYYRISVFKLSIPSLRERSSDIIELAEHFIKVSALSQGLIAPTLSNAAKYILLQYNWPGNVRQLQNVMLYATCMSSEGIIRPEHLPEEITKIKNVPGTKQDLMQIELLSDNPVEENSPSMKDVERMVIKKALDDTNNHIRDAAKLLGLSRSTLYRKIKEYSIFEENVTE